ncbi:ArsR/SmtB family transcription factor [Schleiferilactobacillus perolens]|jgi:DNA-binding transcriptional ArsR family regulator|uniref:HTH arsR-type domain-containing protein n=1 Tax=Schleiferilactobacillus perolens DSM 12744 TaxID=1423792 RepID=A0A0R1MVU2_9LACO|nr:metalloregulator ArsR/SmtB family transcription factor [Schleiferilactobacillus perolens]KRL11657.1 hypothetical protein FD09_GL000579 [Schleiferilactobacillus perolens DSM 12744]MCI2172447.1 metalloregulator ArsR/SmtB family transcription factor [Schleiferilactobacillus perolens]
MVSNPTTAAQRAQERTRQEFLSDIGHLNALASPARQQLLLLLGNKDDSGLTVNELADKIQMSQPATSHHLKILKDIGMIDSYRRKNKVFYYLTLNDTIDRLARILAALQERVKSIPQPHDLHQ